MNDDFVNLKIDGSFIRELTIAPMKKLCINLLRSPQVNHEEQFTKEYDLHFNDLREFSLNVKGQPWLEILNHVASANSVYLSSYLTKRPESERENLSHFEIVCAEGRIDVIAMSYNCSLVAKLPYYETLEDH